ncbi:MAG: hypothetical protein ACI4JZ_02245, partial [Oscillospiraceae bacterium]
GGGNLRAAFEPRTIVYSTKYTKDSLKFKAFLSEKSAARELSDDELNQVAGGKSFSRAEAILSIGTLGIECVISAGVSARSGKCGTAIEGEGMLCEV